MGNPVLCHESSRLRVGEVSTSTSCRVIAGEVMDRALRLVSLASTAVAVAASALGCRRSPAPGVRPTRSPPVTPSDFDAALGVPRGGRLWPAATSRNCCRPVVAGLPGIRAVVVAAPSIPPALSNMFAATASACSFATRHRYTAAPAVSTSASVDIDARAAHLSSLQLLISLLRQEPDILRAHQTDTFRYHQSAVLVVRTACSPWLSRSNRSPSRRAILESHHVLYVQYH